MRILLHKEKANMLKKSINSARFIMIHASAVLAKSDIRKKVCRNAVGLRSLTPRADPPEEDRLWIFFSTFDLLYIRSTLQLWIC